MPVTPPPLITTDVSDPPNRGQEQSVFSPKMDAFLSAFQPLKVEQNDLAAWMEDTADGVETNANAAQGSATSAAASATTASNAASTVVQSATTSATVAGALTPVAGSLSFTLDQTGKAFSVGQWVSISLTSAPASKWMLGAITAFTAGTGAITVGVTDFHGSGSSSGWSVTVSAPLVAVEWGQTTVVAGTSQACANRGSYLFTNTGAQTTATFPASPTSGDKVRIDNGTTRIDLVINPNGEKIMGVSGNMTYNRAGAVEFEFINATYGWRLR